MRSIYLVLGLVLGIWVTSYHAYLLFNEFQEGIDNEVSHHLLVAYQEGYTDGSYNKGMKLRWIVMDTLYELDQCKAREFQRSYGVNRKVK